MTQPAKRDVWHFNVEENSMLAATVAKNKAYVLASGRRTPYDELSQEEAQCVCAPDMLLWVT